jgi:2'-5' RNA ligase
MRCFVAVDIPEEIKEKIAETQKEFSSFDSKLVERKNMHFTLKFLGEISENQIKAVEEKLSALVKKIAPFTVLLSSMGAFPSLSYIRVIWIGAIADEFINLHKNVADALKDIGKPESTPHLTIARIRSPRDKETIARIITRYEKESFGSMLVDKIKLKKSTLTPRGPVYEDMMVFELSH